jgi:hypothetical protein
MMNYAEMIRGNLREGGLIILWSRVVRGYQESRVFADSNVKGCKVLYSIPNVKIRGCCHLYHGPELQLVLKIQGERHMNMVGGQQ